MNQFVAIVKKVVPIVVLWLSLSSETIAQGFANSSYLTNYKTRLARKYMDQGNYDVAFDELDEVIYMSALMRGADPEINSGLENDQLIWKKQLRLLNIYYSLGNKLHKKTDVDLAARLYDSQLILKSFFLQREQDLTIRSRNHNNNDVAALSKRLDDQKRFYSELYFRKNSRGLNYAVQNMERTEAQLINLVRPSITMNTWNEVQGGLKKGEAAIEFIRFLDVYDGNKVKYIGLILKKGSRNPEMIRFENGVDLETKFFENYLHRIDFLKSDTLSYGHFFQPFEGNLVGIKKIYVAPDGIFNLINFATLYNPTTKRYLLEDVDIRKVLSTRDILRDKQQSIPKNRKTRVALIGNPSHLNAKGENTGYRDLPGAEKEVEMIRQLVVIQTEGECNVLTGEAATEERFFTMKMDSSDIVHFACHGSFIGDVRRNFNGEQFAPGYEKYMQGKLVLAQSYPKSAYYDGFLTALDVSTMKLLPNSLIVLSSCETGLGEVDQSEPVFGLQRAFFVAGAKTLVMSYWSVQDDLGNKFMEIFYRNLLVKKMEYRAAFRSTQLEVIKTPFFGHPKSWGAFEMVGP